LDETSSPVPSPNWTRFRSLRWVLGVRYASRPMIGRTDDPFAAL
jgi:hypothetical protein